VNVVAEDFGNHRIERAIKADWDTMLNKLIDSGKAFTSRRKFLIQATSVVVVGQFLYFLGNFVTFPLRKRKTVVFRKPQVFSLKPQVLQKDSAFLLVQSNKITAFSRICPHLGCKLRYNQQKSEFQCPCHGSVFTLTGKLKSGPSLTNMTDLSWSAADDKIYVKLTKNHL